MDLRTERTVASMLRYPQMGRFFHHRNRSQLQACSAMSLKFGDYPHLEFEPRYSRQRRSLRKEVRRGRGTDCRDPFYRANRSRELLRKQEVAPRWELEHRLSLLRLRRQELIRLPRKCEHSSLLIWRVVTYHNHCTWIPAAIL
jgi:hypothetical protein